MESFLGRPTISYREPVQLGDTLWWNGMFGSQSYECRDTLVMWRFGPRVLLWLLSYECICNLKVKASPSGQSLPCWPVGIFLTAASACAVSAQWQTALQVWDDFGEQRVVEDAMIFTSTIREAENGQLGKELTLNMIIFASPVRSCFI